MGFRLIKKNCSIVAFDTLKTKGILNMRNTNKGLNPLSLLPVLRIIGFILAMLLGTTAALFAGTALPIKPISPGQALKLTPIQRQEVNHLVNEIDTNFSTEIHHEYLDSYYGKKHMVKYILEMPNGFQKYIKLIRHAACLNVVSDFTKRGWIFMYDFVHTCDSSVGSFDTYIGEQPVKVHKSKSFRLAKIMTPKQAAAVLSATQQANEVNIENQLISEINSGIGKYYDGSPVKLYVSINSVVYTSNGTRFIYRRHVRFLACRAVYNIFTKSGWVIKAHAGWSWLVRDRKPLYNSNKLMFETYCTETTDSTDTFSK